MAGKARVSNGPLNGVDRSRDGSASAVAVSRSSQGTCAIRTGALPDRFGGRALVVEPQRRGALAETAARRDAVGGEVGEPAAVGSLDRQQRSGRPPAATTIGQPRRSASMPHATARRGRHQANSVTSGTWSEAASSCGSPHARGARRGLRRQSGLAHIWSSRRPRSEASQSFAR